ncbi:MAG TPA: fatty acid desaturase CarF family protein [Gemmatimonadaceae bacterium]|nr:fatty acid desaturase CarF family protein [Gemmatimonadaceae bacterium]
MQRNPASRAKWLFQLSCLLAAIGLAAVFAVRLVGAITTAGDIAFAIGGLTAGMLLADLASGLAHWLFDTYGTSRTPIVGPTFIRNFRLHHVDPLNITHTGFVQINGDNAMLSGMFLLLVLTLTDFGAALAHPAAIAAVLGFGVCATFTNLFHQWAHMSDPPPIARALQRAGLVISPAHHGRHHTAPYRSHYCITLGWMNPVVERVGIFRAIERVFPPTEE